jgi:choline dehydrogenase-like flavoprotein
MTDSADVVVVGSGPAGVSCCFPLVQAGLRVLLVDPGVPVNAVDADRPGQAELRGGHPQKSRYLLGDDLRALRPNIHPSPKLRLGAPPGFVADYLSAQNIIADNFILAGTLAAGGLSNVWGGVTSAFDASDLAGMPISAADLEPSYRRVAARIGISGTLDDDMSSFHGDLPLQAPIPASNLAETLLSRYRRRGSSKSGFKLGLSRNAVLSQALGERGGCTLDALCMWGCSHKSIYNAAYELPALQAFANFTYAPGCLVEKIERIDGGFCVSGKNPQDGIAVSHMGKRLVLAAGTVISTRLVLQLLQLFGQRRRLLNNPAYVFALLLPSKIGSASEARSFAMAQLGYRLPLDSVDEYTTGLLYNSTSVSPADLAEQMPLTLRGGLILNRTLAPAMMLGLGYFDGAQSQNSICVEAGPNGTKVFIEGGWNEDLQAKLVLTRRTLARTFADFGAVLLPGSLRLLPPGGDSHYAGTLGMGDMLSAACEVNDVDGLYVVDGAAFGRLPAKHLTFSIMANADRVGRHIAKQ